MKKNVLYILLVIVSVTCGQTIHSARNQAMGCALHSTSEDLSANFLNPAGLTLFDYHGGIANYTSMYNAFSYDALGSGSAGYSHHLNEFWHMGLTGDFLYSDIFRKNIFSAIIARKQGKFALALRPYIGVIGYREENFIYGDDDIPDDPLFDDGFGAAAFAFDFGTIYSLDSLTRFGLVVKNILEPDLSLSNRESKIPMQIRFGASRQLQHELLVLDILLDKENINEIPINLNFGAESKRFFSNFPIRAGINFEQLALGFGFEKLDFYMMKIDYSFIYPLSKVGQEVPGSHKISLSFGYKIEKKDTIIESPASVPPPPEEPYVRLVVTPDELHLKEVTQVYEEEPLIPIVFFEESSDIVDRRFDPMIKVIGERISRNPDVTLKLYGYFDPRSENNEGFLNIRRAENLRKRFIELVPEAASGVYVVKTSFAPETVRAGLGRQAPTERQQYMINQENRRVEFLLEIAPKKYNPFFLEATNNVDVADAYHPLLKKNPDIDLIIEGGGSSDRFERAFQFEDELMRVIPYEYRNRVFVSLSQSGENRIRLNAHGIIFRPKQVRATVEHSEIETPAKISIEHNVGFIEHAIDIVTLDRQPVRRIAEAQGLPPDKLWWDWTDETGQLVDIRQKYLSRLTGYDETGRYFEVLSLDTLEIFVEEKLRMKSRLLIVQFVYDRDLAQAIYLEDRLEYISRNLIELMHSNKDTLVVTIEGHTDTLGTTRRNEELSHERATEEYENIMLYLKEILRMNDKELGNSLVENKSSIKFEGFGPHDPYTIIKVGTEGLESHLLGDNNLPEGRTINRRVVIELYLETKDIKKDY